MCIFHLVFIWLELRITSTPSTGSHPSTLCLSYWPNLFTHNLWLSCLWYKSIKYLGNVRAKDLKQLILYHDKQFWNGLVKQIKAIIKMQSNNVKDLWPVLVGKYYVIQKLINQTKRRKWSGNKTRFAPPISFVKI